MQWNWDSFGALESRQETRWFLPFLLRHFFFWEKTLDSLKSKFKGENLLNIIAASVYFTGLLLFLTLDQSFLKKTLQYFISFSPLLGCTPKCLTLSSLINFKPLSLLIKLNAFSLSLFREKLSRTWVSKNAISHHRSSFDCLFWYLTSSSPFIFFPFLLLGFQRTTNLPKSHPPTHPRD